MERINANLRTADLEDSHYLDQAIFCNTIMPDGSIANNISGVNEE